MLSGYEIELIETQDAAGEKKVSTEEGLKNLEALFGGL